MGMNTLLKFKTRLTQETPEIVVQALKFMTGQMEKTPRYLPKHNFFRTERWDCMLQMDSEYFEEKTKSELIYDSDYKAVFLNVTCNFKNYNNEISEFIDWIMIYCSEEPGALLGSYRFEESKEEILIYKKDEKEQKRAKKLDEIMDRSVGNTYKYKSSPLDPTKDQLIFRAKVKLSQLDNILGGYFRGQEETLKEEEIIKIQRLERDAYRVLLDLEEF